mgnify:CR=1 FL=1
MSRKFFCLVLHSHIPFVLNHGGWPHGSDWLYEASAESYLPLLRILERLAAEGISPRLNISFTPVLMEQLKSQAFISGFKKYLRMKIDISLNDQLYFEKTASPHLASLASFWEGFYQQLYEDFVFTWKEDILTGFKRLQDEGLIEVMTSAATHAYLPLLSRERSIRSQIDQGKLCYYKHFGRPSKGFWLPECAYRPRRLWQHPFKGGPGVVRPGLDELLAEAGLKYFFVESHLLRGGEARGVYLDRFPALRRVWEGDRNGREFMRPKGSLSVYLPYLSQPAGMAFFVRDPKSGQQVWSSKQGYPGDGWYLEFHKKHFPGGLRYWRITESQTDLREKQPYSPQKAAERLEDHASHFVRTLVDDLQGQNEAVVVSLYDTELFGHWWFEGPEWLYLVIKKLASSEVKLETASNCLDFLEPNFIVGLNEGSWGAGGFHWTWFNDDTAWVWEKIYQLEEETEALSFDQVSRKERIWRQLAREKFLLESSDWPFLISTWTARDYAENRAAEHYQRAKVLLKWLRRLEPLDEAEERRLEIWEKEDNLFAQFVVGPAGKVWEAVSPEINALEKAHHGQKKT